ncbi:MAG: alpha-galactosidase [Verrucomicrobiae bacterium]|nr:alpha-galactosidase [Verrucomicrobiae bacterium]
MKKNNCLVFDGKSGRFHLQTGESSASGVLCLRGEDFQVKSINLQWKRRRGSFVAQGACATAAFQWIVTIENGLLEFCVKNTGHKDWRLKGGTLAFSWDGFHPRMACGDYFQYVNTSPTIHAAGVRAVGRESFGIPLDAVSQTLTVFQNKKNQSAFLLGTGTDSAALATFKVNPEAAHWESHFGFEADFQCECVIRKGTGLALARLLCLHGSDPLELLRQYGKRLGASRRMPIKRKITGWNSWDYYHGAIRKTDIIRNTSVLKKKLPTDRLWSVIDDGWQCRWGDWEETNHHFPGGLKSIGTEISRRGVVPGIWLAPYCVHAYSIIARHHPECLLRDEQQRLVEKVFSCGKVYVLDPTHPVTKKHIRTTFRRLRQRGFKYFKLDFCSPQLEGRNFHDGSSPATAYRKGLKWIRETVGREAYLISGEYSIEAGAGLLDAARVCGDIHVFWGHIRRNAKEIAARFWLNDAVWNNDPDFLIVRSPECVNSKSTGLVHQTRPETGQFLSWLDGREMGMREAVTWASVVMLSGGDILLSDNLEGLNSKGWKLIQTVLKNRLTSAARPLDLFSHHPIPELWLGKGKKHWFLGIFNWTDDARRIEVDWDSEELSALKSKRMEDVWTGQVIEPSGTGAFNIEAHGVKLLQIG